MLRYTYAQTAKGCHLRVVVHVNFTCANDHVTCDYVGCEQCVPTPGGDGTGARAAGLLVNNDGSVSPVVHQYDRFPELVEFAQRLSEVPSAERS